MNTKLTSPEKHLLLLDKFGGADFSSNPTQVSVGRSPDMQNMITDSRFFPVKRMGWKKLCQGEGKVYGLHRFVDAEGKSQILVHIGTGFFRYDDVLQTLTTLWSGMNESRSTAFIMNGKLYLLDGQTYLQYDGQSVSAVTENATYVPITLIKALPIGTGTGNEAPNLLNPMRINCFFGDGVSTYYKLDTDHLDSTAVTVTVNGVAKTENSHFTVNRTTGAVTFTAAPAKSEITENVLITFAKTITGGVDKINRCRFFGMFGGDSDTCVFVSGNPDYKNTDWVSGAFDPTYFPDTGESAIGSDACAIAGYLKQFDTQIILKEPDGEDAAQFLRTASSKGFAVAQGAAGVGAVSQSGMTLLEDVPLILTRQGVYAVSGTSVVGQRTLRCRSALINKKLLAEENLSSAVLAEHEGKCYLCVNSHCYVADSRQTFTDNSATQYEWYYWENIPAVCFLSIAGTLYFGTEDGKLCRFYTSGETDCYNDDGDAIDAYWTTPYLCFNRWDKYKTVQNVHVVPLPYARSSLNLYYNTEDIMRSLIRRENIDLFSFDNLDFSRFTFRSIQAPVPFAAGQKQRNIVLFQTVVQNNVLNEAFGFLAIQINYTVGGNIK